ncbi:MAG: response regulator [Candidatus Sumerlaeia bacterium]|nr:response regulator [Candidatus Sumerlaeia bacterium]
MKADPLRILIAEDSEDDALLVVRTLRRAGMAIDWHRVETVDELRRALRDGAWDVVLSDYSMPRLDGLKALTIVRGHDMDVPFIVVSGSIGEELAADVIRAGAQDVLMKDRLDRLAGVLERELADARLRRRHRTDADALAESQERLQLALDATQDGIWDLRFDGNRHFFSDRMYTMLGYEPVSPEETPAFLYEHMHPEDIETVRTTFETFVASGGDFFSFDLRMRAADGSWHTILSRAKCLGRDAEGRALRIVGTHTDITDRVQAEWQIARLSAVVEQSPNSVMITEPDGTIVYVNPSFEQVTGYRSEEAVGKTPRLLKSGRHAPVFFRELWQTITAGEVWHGTIVNRRKDGTLYQEETEISPVRDPRGRIAGFVAIKRDVTDRMARDAQRRQSQKMEALGTLAGGIAHDFNNILQGILGYTEMAAEDLPRDSVPRAHLDEVMMGGQRAAELIRQILAFSRQSEQTRQPIQLPGIVREALRLLRSILPASVRIAADIAPDCALVMADPVRIHQLVMNLGTNAAQAMRDKGGTLHVRLELAEISTATPTLSCELEPGPHVRLVVRDEGHGIEPAVLERIFEPYFTTRQTTGGSGLGMAVVHSILMDHRAGIRIESEVGVGTTFTIDFPATDRGSVREDQPDTPAPEPAPQAPLRRVLFVDDEESLVRLAQAGLPRFGFAVHATTSSTQALRVFRENPDAFDAIVTDLAMPDLTGIELAGQIRILRPGMPILLYTGFSDRADDERIGGVNVTRFAHKPIVLRKLAEEIRGMLDGVGSGS